MESLHEEWRPVVGFEGYYEVSNKGDVRSLSRDVPCLSRWGKPRTFRMSGRTVRNWLSGSGYLNVSLNAGGRKENHQVHRLVMAAFVGVPGERHVNHRDGNKRNNALSNLEYVTPKENAVHAMDSGLMLRDGEKNPAAKFTADQIREAHARVAAGATYREASESSGVTTAAIVSVCHGKTWRSLGLPVIRRMPIRAHQN